jgi:hypothetical protein
MDQHRIGGSEEVNLILITAESWRNSSIIVKIGSSIFFIDQEERDSIRRIDLQDNRAFTLRLPAFLTSIAASSANILGSGKAKSANTSSDFLFVLSRASESVFKVRVDISLLVLVETIKLSDLEDHKPSLIEYVGSQNLIVVSCEKEASSDAFSNKILAIDIKISKEVARRDLVVRGKASWFERLEVCEFPEDRIYLGFISMHQFNFYLVKIELPGPSEEINSEQTRLRTEDSHQNLRNYHFLEDSNKVVLPTPRFKLLEVMAVFRSHKCRLVITQYLLMILSSFLLINAS